MKLQIATGACSALLLVASAISGCSEEKFVVRPGLIVTNAESVAWCDLPFSAPVVVIGNKKLTKGDLLNSVSNEYFALVARGEKAREIAKKFDGSRVELAAQHVARFLHNGAFLLRADELGIVADENEIAGQWAALSNIAEKTKMSITKFASCNGHPTLASLDRFIRENIRISKIFKLTFSNRLEVAEKEVDVLYGELEEGNRRAAATNAIYLAELRKFREGLNEKKIPFTHNDEENAKKVPPSLKVEWFVKAPGNSFDDEENVVGKVRYQRLNTWSDPMEDDSAYSIYYMTEIEQKSSEAPTLFTGFRVFCEKDCGYLVPDKKKLMADMRKRRNIEVVTPEFDRLCRHFGVLYPYGLIWRDIFSDRKISKGAKR